MIASRFGLSVAQWQVVKSGPLHMFKHVAGADSHIDRVEWTALVEALGGVGEDQDEFVVTVMREVSEELARGAGLEELDGFEGLAGLRAVALVLDSLPDRGLAYREMLLELGATVAEASGQQLTRVFVANHLKPGWVRSAGTSAHEREALEIAAEALGLAHG